MKITNNLNLPQPFVDAATREYTYKDKQYSVTSLLKGTCQTILERRHYDEIEQDVADMVWLIFGTAVHSILERGKETENQLKENKIVIELDNGYKLSGIFDLYDAETKTVTDWKTGSVWKAILDDWGDYEKQLQIYAYMLRQIGFECDKGEIVLLMKDHNKKDAKYKEGYPQHATYKKTFKITDRQIEDIESYIFKKFEHIAQCENMPDDELPPCTPKERWHKDDKYAVMKKGRKTAIKLFDDEESANEWVEKLGLNYYVEFREGKDGRCDDYCSVKDFCPFYKMKHENIR